MNDRVWEWWSVKQEGNILIFDLVVDGWPYSIDAFKHLVKSAGALTVTEKE
jgi:hypothetical protein